MTWKKPELVHGKPCKYGYTVYYPENFELGENADVGYFTFIQARHGVRIGENSQIGGGCQIYSADSEGGYAGPVKIGQCVNVGANSTIFPNVTIDDGAVVGAKSLVLHGTHIKAGELWLGCPAKKQTKVWAVTGGTGSIGRAVVEYLLEYEEVDSIRVISRDEAKHAKMQAEINDDRVRYIIGDVTDKEMMMSALRDVDIVIHAAAMKRVETSEYNAGEVVRVNVGGSINVARACMACKVKKMLLVSTDKSVNPIGVMGKSKSLAESIILDQYMRIGGYTKFYVVRLGNIMGSRGSVLEIWDSQDVIKVTDPEATRFFLTKFEAASWIATRVMSDPGLHIPRCRALRVGDLAEAYCEIHGKESEVVGMRAGERQHEAMMTEKEATERGIECWESDKAKLMTKDEIKELLNV